MENIKTPEMSEFESASETAELPNEARDFLTVGIVATAGRIKPLKEFFAALCVVQDPSEAEYDGMPRSAVATSLVDLILPVAEMPAKILAFKNASRKPVCPKAKRQSCRPNSTPPRCSKSSRLSKRRRNTIFLITKNRPCSGASPAACWFTA